MPAKVASAKGERQRPRQGTPASRGGQRLRGRAPGFAHKDEVFRVVLHGTGAAKVRCVQMDGRSTREARDEDPATFRTRAPDSAPGACGGAGVRPGRGSG